SKGGVIRGLHFQKGKYVQAKLVRCTKGELLDVVADIRKGSPTYGKHVEVILSEKNKYLLYVPRGCAHGFATLSDEVEMEYKNDALYSPENEGGVIWNDPDLKVKWPIKNPIISEKDKRWPRFKEVAEF
ncbi:MAG: dTDP-4-dehydrorhamnose 3,5-epimerase, partial [archaeon]|nr:dTDP-4-dehydrorhamnose 3,5-epimerase [archaeon]